jgi:hypothetical protein
MTLEEYLNEVLSTTDLAMIASLTTNEIRLIIKDWNILYNPKKVIAPKHNVTNHGSELG